MAPWNLVPSVLLPLLVAIVLAYRYNGRNNPIAPPSDGRGYFAGDYMISTPGFFLVQEPTHSGSKSLLRFALDKDGEITFTDPTFRSAMVDYAMEFTVLFHGNIHPQADTSSNINTMPLGPLCRIRWTWMNDAGPELYELGLLPEGPGYHYHPIATRRRLKADRQVALVFAFLTTNDGDPWSGPDLQASLVSFFPAPGSQ
ncbi:expressed unknown protein [Seminavis robusta]|uniref:Uncharacterized protein n=1 Tax=Seminavis robusta TaxID=568900 RepID=A0A9N8DTQ0_9STRA|nr:expressed unknown protein [Seminavis robusta]|eukprot:Sro243_g096850.1 n/a (200) ;mRNA; f:29114-29713